jgi:hypothetical protein
VTTAPEGPLDIICITGWSYSGSTLLGNILGQLEGVFAAGEVGYVWQRGFVENLPCGCGAPFRSCPLWSRVAGAHLANLDEGRLAAIGERLLRVRAFPELTRAVRGRGRLAHDAAEYVAALGSMYRGIHLTTGSSVIVDSTKAPGHAYLAQTIPGVNVTVIQLVRDPRGTAFSHRRRDARTKLCWSMGLWHARHALTELVWGGGERYLRLRYEDFVREPVGAVAAVLRLVGRSPDGLRLSSNEIWLEPNHNLYSNRNALRSGATELRLDDEWRVRLTPRDRVLAEALTWPLRRRYGYRREVRSRASRAPAPSRPDNGRG